ncbi:beta-lactamase/transpeptidase-like protein [Coprinopsis sp. MPI-PUGE-AT-0042]|nr:beta-lactamase/transpeptidase-like protein [Coprinopsis sp. MPI-PUGE-AT-0042]
MRPLSSAIWLGLISLFAASPIDVENPTPSGPFSPVLKPETLEIIKNVTTTLGLPGAIVAFTSSKGDGVLTFGNRTVDGDPVSPNAHFALASNSKLFLGTILAWLAEKDTKLDNGKLATTLDFLAHRTGIPQHNLAINPNDTPRVWMERFAFLRPNTKFRSTMAYSNANYAAITYVVELLTEKRYPWEWTQVQTTLGSKCPVLISQGWIGQGVNYTTCFEELSATPGATGYPLPCAGKAEGFEFWTDGSGQEWSGGQSFAASGYAPFTIATVELSDAGALEAAPKVQSCTRHGIKLWPRSSSSTTWTVHSTTPASSPLYNTSILFTRPGLHSGSNEGAYLLGQVIRQCHGRLHRRWHWILRWLLVVASDPPAVEVGVEETAEGFFSRQ